MGLCGPRTGAKLELVGSGFLARCGDKKLPSGLNANMLYVVSETATITMELIPSGGPFGIALASHFTWDGSLTRKSSAAVQKRGRKKQLLNMLCEKKNQLCVPSMMLGGLLSRISSPVSRRSPSHQQ